ncbi:MAG TPA: hypothetical protein VE779_07025 [Candidatus Angelobacter sp.]|nr:hypothetical protein [Candidatus Angelobacter sp.]
MNQTAHPGFQAESATARLALLEELIVEVQAAYESLAADRLGAFRESVWRLEAACARWQRLNAEASPMRGRSSSEVDAVGPRDGTICAAHRRLSVANYRLAALLRRCRRSVGILSLHYHATFHEPCAGAAIPYNRHSWSEEA